MSDRWIGKSVRRVEDFRLLTGRGTFIDDHPPVGNIHHAAIVRSRYAHARLVGYDVTRARAAEGVVAVITGEHVAKETRPFAVGVTTPVHYYCAATDKVRFVGEPVAVVVARDRYLAEDAADLVEVEYEPLPAVIDPEKALEPDAPVLHEKVGTNLAGHRRLVYGDPERAFREAEVVLRERFRFPKYGSTPIETYGIIAPSTKKATRSSDGPTASCDSVVPTAGLCPKARLCLRSPPTRSGCYERATTSAS